MSTPCRPLREHLLEYLSMRRTLGFQLVVLEHLAGQFCDWLTAQGKTTFTTSDAVTWARLPADADHKWWGMRLGAVRTFAAYLNATGIDVEVPPAGILPTGANRSLHPYIYSQQDLDALMAACAHTFTRELIVETMRTTIALLAATGLRIGEALRLRPGDVDADARALTVAESKNRMQRLVPLDPTTIDALATYRSLPVRAATRPAGDGPLLVSTRGTGYLRSTVEAHFAAVVNTAGLQAHGRARPRLHDLRHTFATAHMAAAYRCGADPQRTLTLLATWLGHTSAAHTYWYLTATPELMALAARRLENEEASRP